MKDFLIADTQPEAPAGSIVREIDGAIYTALIHFNLETKETAKDKIKRLIRKEVSMRRIFSVLKSSFPPN